MYVLKTNPVIPAIMRLQHNHPLYDRFTACTDLPADFTNLPYRNKPFIISHHVTNTVPRGLTLMDWDIQFFAHGDDYLELEDLSFSVFNHILYWGDHGRYGNTVQVTKIIQAPTDMTDGDRRYQSRFSWLLRVTTDRENM